jgi:hypothetical protein
MKYKRPWYEQAGEIATQILVVVGTISALAAYWLVSRVMRFMIWVVKEWFTFETVDKRKRTKT